MARKVKIKLPFLKNTSVEERQAELKKYADVLLHGRSGKLLEELHYSTGSYIVLEDPGETPKPDSK